MAAELHRRRRRAPEVIAANSDAGDAKKTRGRRNRQASEPEPEALTLPSEGGAAKRRRRRHGDGDGREEYGGGDVEGFVNGGGVSRILSTN